MFDIIGDTCVLKFVMAYLPARRAATQQLQHLSRPIMAVLLHQLPCDSWHVHSNSNNAYDLRASNPSFIRISSSCSRTALWRAYSSSKPRSSTSDLVRSVRAMPIKLISVGKGNSKAAQAMAQEWLEKLARQVGQQAARPGGECKWSDKQDPAAVQVLHST